MTAAAPQTEKAYGLMAQFRTPEELVSAAKAAKLKGFRQVEAFSPFPIPELNDALKIRDRRLPFFVLMAGLMGCFAGFMLQYFVSVIAYPLNVGGRPVFSWPSFIPVTFEMTILFAAGTAVFGMILLNGLPRPYHPVFNGRHFERATLDRFFLCIASTDPQFDATGTKNFLADLHPEYLEEIAS